MKNFAKDIKENKIRNIYYFYGDERYLIDRYIKKAEKAILPDKLEGVNFDVLNYQETGISRIINDANTIPFLGEFKLLVIKNSELLSKEKQLSPYEIKNIEKYFSNPNPSCVLIFLGEEDLKNIGRNKVALLIKNSPQGRLIESRKLKGMELRRWIQTFLDNNKVDISPEVMEMLMMIGEKGLYNLHGELEKLILSGDGSIISKDQAQDLLTLTPEGKIFELTDAVINKQGNKALKLLDEYFAAREQPIILRAMLISSFRRMILVKNALEEGYVKPVFREYLDTKSDFLIDKTIRQVKNISSQELTGIYDDLYNLEFDSRNSKQEQGALLKDFVIKTVF